MQTLTTTVLSALVSQSRAALPCEACGYLIYCDNQVFSLPNGADDPTAGFHMDSELIQQAWGMWGSSGIALWHSHPKTRACPSLEDGGLLQSMHPIPMIIVSLKSQVPLIRCYEWGSRGPVEVASYRVSEAVHETA